MEREREWEREREVGIGKERPKEGTEGRQEEQRRKKRRSETGLDCGDQDRCFGTNPGYLPLPTYRKWVREEGY